ncbi:hypothetical protein RCL_jg17039.t1 [Rhizophagus clarus]|uniref:Uncharacterized protein n=1 Tax=Rhizophagus clarus TaxID=94130 RepID=A0A8H3LN06_9GLOM|nr:hypothetical protein RCL_jg17039.t1 [Rhizophagus clarus]
MSKSDCSKEYQYLVKTSKHHLAHSQEQVEKNDPSCEICWPVQRDLIENTNQPFAIFWKSILQPRSEEDYIPFKLSKFLSNYKRHKTNNKLEITSQFQNTIFKKMSGLTEDSSKSSSDTTTTIEDEQLKENTESNENESQKNNKEAKNKKKENNEEYMDSSNLHIRDTSENPIGNSKSISSSSTSPLQYRPSFRYNDLYDEPSITVP